MTITEAAEAVLIALEKLADEEKRLCNQPATVIADTAGVSVADVHLAFRRLHRTSRIYTAGVPMDPSEKCLILLPGAPWPGQWRNKQGQPA